MNKRFAAVKREYKGNRRLGNRAAIFSVSRLGWDSVGTCRVMADQLRHIKLADGTSVAVMGGAVVVMPRISLAGADKFEQPVVAGRLVAAFLV